MASAAGPKPLHLARMVCVAEEGGVGVGGSGAVNRVKQSILHSVSRTTIPGLHLLIFFLVALLLAGCGKANFSSSKPAGNVFRVPLDVPLMSLDPALVSETWSIDTLQNTFEGLTKMSEANTPQPNLAATWDISSDGRTYTFHLGHGILFQNGREFKALDVKKSFERSCSKELAAPLASDFLGDIAGMAAFHAGNAPSITGIKVLDDYTVSIQLDAPHPYFLAKLSLPVATVVATEALKDGIHIRSVDEMVGTGPFKVEKYIEGQMVVQKAFLQYHGVRPKIDEIDRPIMPDAPSRMNAFKRGEIDTIQQLARSDYVELTKDPKYKSMVSLVPRATLTYMALNTADFPDVRVRQAIAMAIDRELIANDYLFGTVIPAKGILPIGIPGYRENPNWLAPNVEEARKLLRDSGHADGAGLPELHISFAMENPDIERIADQIGSQLTSKLGITVRLDKMETAALIAKQNQRQLSCVVSGWFADYIDPEDFLSMLLTTSSPENHWHYSNPRYDALCRQADTCTDAKQRFDLYAKAEDLALQDAVLIPLSYWETPIIVSPRVHGVHSYAAQFLPYNSVWLGPG